MCKCRFRRPPAIIAASEIISTLVLTPPVTQIVSGALRIGLASEKRNNDPNVPTYAEMGFLTYCRFVGWLLCARQTRDGRGQTQCGNQRRHEQDSLEKLSKAGVRPG
jgi:hypothetical protein